MSRIISYFFLHGPFARHRSVQLSLFVLLLALCLPFSCFAKDPATIVRVVDGDTLAVTLTGRHEKVRLIGVDTPEVHESDKLHSDAARTRQDEATIKALGKRASDFAQSLVHSGDQVELEYDQQPRDRYHRLLAFVWLADGRMLNEVLVCEGYANAHLWHSYSFPTVSACGEKGSLEVPLVGVALGTGGCSSGSPGPGVQ